MIILQSGPVLLVYVRAKRLLCCSNPKLWPTVPRRVLLPRTKPSLLSRPSPLGLAPRRRLVPHVIPHCCLAKPVVCFGLLGTLNVIFVQQYVKRSCVSESFFGGEDYRLSYDPVWSPPVSALLLGFCTWQQSWRQIALSSSKFGLFVCFFCNLCMDLITNSTLSLKQPAVALKMISVPKVKCYLGTICKWLILQ